MSKKIIGVNFLHPHRNMETQLNLDSQHLIVDGLDYEQVVAYFRRYPGQLKELDETTRELPNKPVTTQNWREESICPIKVVIVLNPEKCHKGYNHWECSFDEGTVKITVNRLEFYALSLLEAISKFDKEEADEIHITYIKRQVQ